MTAWFAVALLALGAAAYVLAPLFRPGAAEAERTARVLSEEQDLESQREMALSALRDLEDDRATGKIGDHDYDDLKARLSSRAVDVLKRLDALRLPPA
jgi:cytochrome c-type biogenesis protein CcmH/NrfG